MDYMQRNIFNSTQLEIMICIEFSKHLGVYLFRVKYLLVWSHYLTDPEKQTDEGTSFSSNVNVSFCFPPVSETSFGSISFSTMTSSVRVEVSLVLTSGPDSWSLTGVIIT